MNAPATRTAGSTEARNLRWLLDNLIEEVPGIRSVAVVSSDGLLLLSSDPAAGEATPEAVPSGADGAPAQAAGPRGSSADLATIVSGVGSLTVGAAKLMDGGPVRQTMVAMDEGSLFVMAISDGSLLGVHAAPECEMNVIAYHMALFVGRAGHVLTPEVRSALRSEIRDEPDSGPDGRPGVGPDIGTGVEPVGAQGEPGR